MSECVHMRASECIIYNCVYGVCVCVCVCECECMYVYDGSQAEEVWEFFGLNYCTSLRPNMFAMTLTADHRKYSILNMCPWHLPHSVARALRSIFSFHPDSREASNACNARAALFFN